MRIFATNALEWCVECTVKCAEELQERPHTAIAITQAPSLLQQCDTAAMTLATAPETSEECD